MGRVELDDFYNDGFGWICRRCERELKGPETSDSKHSRLMREGESESKQPRLSNLAMAKWADKEQKTLLCPRCGLTKQIGKF
jgi:hypothetical protein